MSNSLNPDPSDPYFIPSVPMYRDFNKEIDLNDTLGDRFFEEMGHTIENTPPKAVVPEDKPQQPQQQGREWRISRSVIHGNSSKALKMAAAAEEKEVLKVQAKPRPISRRSVSMARELKPTTSDKVTAQVSENAITAKSVEKMAEQKQQPEANVKVEKKEAEVAEKRTMEEKQAEATMAFVGKKGEVAVKAVEEEKQPGKVATTAPAIARPWNLRSSRSLAVVPAVIPPSPTPKPQISNANKSAIVQPPMRFGNVPNNRRTIAPSDTSIKGSRTTAANNEAENEVPRVLAKPRPISRRSMSVARELQPNSQNNTLPAVVEEKQPATGKVVARPWTLRSSRPPAVPPAVAVPSTQAIPQASNATNKPAIVQPPMRFGNISITRRSIAQSEASTSKVQLSLKGITGGGRGPVTTPSRATDISHAVRGINVVRQTPTKNNNKQPTMSDE